MKRVLCCPSGEGIDTENINWLSSCGSHLSGDEEFRTYGEKKLAFYNTDSDWSTPIRLSTQEGRGCMATLLNFVVRHLEGRKTHVCLCFADFSSAFNFMQPHFLAQRLSNISSIEFGTICWLVDFLTTRPQRTRVNETLSETLSCSTGSPQVCVLSPLPFMLYTNDCKSMFKWRIHLS